MRLLTLSPYPPFLGGLPVHVRELSQGLAAGGHEVWVVTLDESAGSGAPGTGTAVRDEQGVRVCRVPGLPGTAGDYLAQYERQNLRASEGVAACYRAGMQAPDLVVCHGHFLGLAALSAVRVSGAPLVFHVHNMMSADVGQSAELRDYFLDVERALVETAAHLVPISSYIADMCPPLGRQPSDMTVIPKGLHMEEFAGAWSPQQPPTLLFVGRISPEKGLETLFEAVAKVREQMSVRLLIAGAGNEAYVDQVKAAVRESGLERAVAFIGAVPPERLPQLYRSATLTVVPSYMEALGRVALEAMAAGCPVVVSDVGGLGPLVDDDVTGRKVPAHDGEALAAAIRAALLDPEGTAAMADKARAEVSETYSWTRISKATLDVYETVLARS